MISVSPPLINSVINPPQLSSVCQQISRSSQNTPSDNRCFNSKGINSKSNDFSSPVIPVLPPFNDSVINPPQLSLVCQQKCRSSYNTTHEFQASSIPSWTLPDPLNNMSPSSTNNGGCNIYGCIVYMSKLTLAHRQQNDVMLLQHYHELCNTNDHSSMFVSPPPITNIESLSKSTISSLDSGSFGRNLADVNIRQPNKSEVANTETVVAYNEDIDPPPPQDISNVFSAADFLSQSSSDSEKYKRAWHKAKVIRSSILSAGESPDACSRSLYIALNHKCFSSIMAVTGAIFQKDMPTQLPDMKKRRKYCPMQHLLVIKENKQKTEKSL